jgi:hypothetical protein
MCQILFRVRIYYVVIIICLVSSHVFAAGGTEIVATKGHSTTVSATWPEGVGKLVNDPTRTTGWNSWFTEWPNDVKQYGFEIKTIDDLNRLIRNLASIKSEVRQIRLSPLKEPQGLGWVTRLPEGNSIAVIFSIGDQSRIDEWYKHVRKPFGVMEFLAAPVAVPPTLTIFVQNDSVTLEELQIPNEIIVTGGYLPGVFHRSNTTTEKKQEEEVARRPIATSDSSQSSGDRSTQAAADKINAFLKDRNNANGITK